MSASQDHKILHEIVRDFEQLKMLIDQALAAFAQDDSGSVNLAALQKAKDTAERGANVARSATSDVRRAVY